MRIACVVIRNFAARAARRRDPTLVGRPVVVSGQGGGESRQRVVDCSDEAYRFGVRVGIPVSGVTSLCPEAVILSGDPVAETAAWETILGALLLVSPVVEDGGPGCAYLDLKGLYHLYASPAHLLGEVAAAVSEEWSAQVGAGPGAFAARLAANKARPGTPLGLNLRTAPAFRRQQPCSTLPVSEAMRRRLKLFGLRTLGELAALPRGAVLAQFGTEGGEAWDLASGRDRTHLAPHTPPERIVERVDLPEPTPLMATIVIACADLIARTLRHPALGGRTVRTVRLDLAIEGGRSWSATVHLKGATADRARLLLALRSRLNAAPPDGPVEALTLELAEFAGFAGHQPPLFRLGEDGLLPPRDEVGFAGAVDELKARYGGSPIARIVEVEPWSRLPERRYMLVDSDR